MSSRISADLVPAALPAADEPSTDEATRLPSASVQVGRREWVLRLGVLFAVLAWALIWYWDSAASMAAIWWRSETFAHGLVVYPISAWLIWRMRAELRAVECAPSYLALLFVGLAGFGWLLGDLGGVQAARHLGFVAIVVFVVWTVLGTTLARAIAFPLAFTFLAVPVGEFMLPMLIEHTADFTVGALRMTGIPVYREGNDFVVPTGSWSVVEACSGLRYLIASVTLGLLYAYLSYTSMRRRVLFVLASIIVPIVANWMRAYMIVMIGHLSGMKYAVGVDHLLYGWVFFGVVMLLLFWVGSFWREDDMPARKASRPAPGVPSSRPTSSLLSGALLAAVVVTAAPAYSIFLDARSSGVAGVTLAAPTPVNGWTPQADAAVSFRPHYTGATSLFEQSFRKGERVVGLYIGYYANQREGREMIAFGNAIVSSDDPSRRLIAQKRLTGHGEPGDTVQTRIRAGRSEATVLHWYWAGDRWVARPQMVKVLQAFDKLRGKGDDSAVIVAYSQEGANPREVEAALEQFASDMAPSIAAVLTNARSLRQSQAAAAPDSASK